MTARQMIGFYLSLVAVSSSIALGLAVYGAWMVLPFWGIDLAAVGVALLVMDRRSGDFERVSLTAGELIVEVSTAGHSQVIPMNRHWVRVESEDGFRYRLFLAQHGRRLVVGRFIGDAERRRFGQELRSALAV